MQLGSLTFPTKAQYMALSSKQPPVPFQVLNTWHDCDHVSVFSWSVHARLTAGLLQVIIRWISRQTPQQVQGFTAMQVVPNQNHKTARKYPFLINKTFGEFNSGAWLVNLGNPQCGSS